MKKFLSGRWIGILVSFANSKNLEAILQKHEEVYLSYGLAFKGWREALRRRLSDLYYVRWRKGLENRLQICKFWINKSRIR